MGNSYWESLKKIVEVSEKYKKLELIDFIRMTLLECGFDDNMMYNVYINEDVSYPEAFGCYKKDDKIVAYFINSFGEKRIKEYTNYADFMLMFVRTAKVSSKYRTSNKTL